MPVRNYDDTVAGEYIRSMENPDSVGWNPYIDTWFAPPAGKGYDLRNRGMGVDVYNNRLAVPVVQGRPGKTLSRQEERDIRNATLEYCYSVIDRYRKRIPASRNMSQRKEAEALGLVYRGDGNLLWKDDNPLGKAYRSENEEDFHKAVDEYYKGQGLNRRASNNASFWKRGQRPKEGMLETTLAERLRQQDSAKLPWVKADGGSLRKPWEGLSMAEKAEYIGVAVRNGIHRPSDIRAAYRSFAEGGEVYFPADSYHQAARYGNRFEDGGSFLGSMDEYADKADDALTYLGLGATAASAVPNPVTPLVAYGASLASIPVDAWQAGRAFYKEGITSKEGWLNAGETLLDVLGGKIIKGLVKPAKAGTVIKSYPNYARSPRLRKQAERQGNVKTHVLSAEEAARRTNVARTAAATSLEGVNSAQHYGRSRKKALGGNLFEDGGWARENGNPVAFDGEGNLVDQVTGEQGTMMLPNVYVTPSKSAHRLDAESVYRAEHGIGLIKNK